MRGVVHSHSYLSPQQVLSYPELSFVHAHMSKNEDATFDKGRSVLSPSASLLLPLLFADVEGQTIVFLKEG